MAISTPFTRLSADRHHLIYKNGVEDTVLTLEFKNLNPYKVSFTTEIFDENGNALIGKPIQVEINENRVYKKYNLLVKDGSALYVKASVSGLAARVYKPALFAIPGQLSLLPSSNQNIKLFLDHTGNHEVVCRALPNGLTITPERLTVSEGSPVEFNASRGAGGCSSGQIQFYIPTLNISTIVDFAAMSEVIDDGNSDDDDQFDADLVAAYNEGKDHVTEISP